MSWFDCFMTLCQCIVFLIYLISFPATVIIGIAMIAAVNTEDKKLHTDIKPIYFFIPVIILFMLIWTGIYFNSNDIPIHSWSECKRMYIESHKAPPVKAPPVQVENDKEVMKRLKAMEHDDAATLRKP